MKVMLQQFVQTVNLKGLVPLFTGDSKDELICPRCSSDNIEVCQEKDMTEVKTLPMESVIQPNTELFIHNGNYTQYFIETI